MIFSANTKKWALITIAVLVTATWQSSCICKSNAAAHAALFQPGTIKFQRVYR